MVSDEGLRRLALGLSNSHHPEYDSLRNHFRQIDLPGLTPNEAARGPFYVSINPNHGVHYGKVFDTRGRPCSINTLRINSQQEEAMNKVIELVVTAEYSKASDEPHNDQMANTNLSPSDMRNVRQFLSSTVDFAAFTLHFYLGSVLAHVLVWKSSEHASFAYLLYQDLSDPVILGASTIQWCAYLCWRPFERRWTKRIHSLIPRFNPSNQVASKTQWGVMYAMLATTSLALCPIAIMNDLNMLGLIPWRSLVKQPSIPHIDLLSLRRAAANFALAVFIPCGVVPFGSMTNHFLGVTLMPTTADSTREPRADRSPPWHGPARALRAVLSLHTTAWGALRSALPAPAAARLDLASTDYARHVVWRALTLPLYALELRCCAAGFALLMRGTGHARAAQALEAGMRVPWLRFGAAGLRDYASKVGLCLVLNGLGLLALSEVRRAVRRAGPR